MMLQRIVERGTATIVLLFAAGLAAAQFTSGVNLVEVYATVTDAQGQPITGLTPDNFRVLEDGRPQAVTTFAAGEFPLAVAIGIDRSFSMAGGKGGRLAMAQAAARTFIRSLRSADRVMVLAIGSETEVVTPPTSDHAAALAAIDRLEPWGTTPLYDATLAALDTIQPEKGRRALLLVSDGTDRYSETTAATLVEQARRRDVLVYPIAIGSARPPVFAELATATGGRSFFVRDARELDPIVSAIAQELRFQYLLGYVPPRSAPDETGWRSIEVMVDRPGARVRAREGYYAR